ncbi:MAG TPA: nucleotidyl transferase AbiEii/AbiGii toxin family protein [Patescibacteria group bacterium]|jgi:hypothetical protein
MFTDKIPSWTQQLMGLLAPLLSPDSYLAGGTALALHLNHRSSYDLDIYTPRKFDEQLILQKFETEIPDFQLVSVGEQTIIGGSRDTEISLFFYQYPLLESTETFAGMQITALADLACMKLEAIASRGLKRDFFDLYTICQLDDWSLKKVIDLTEKKFKRQGSNLPHLLKSLVYFEDAETKPERAKIIDEEWQAVKEFFIRETPLILKDSLV